MPFCCGPSCLHSPDLAGRPGNRNHIQMASAEARTPGSGATHVRHGVLAFTLALTAISYLDRVCISMAAPFIKEELHLSQRQIGLMFGAFTLAYAVLEVSAGWLADRFGPRLMFNPAGGLGWCVIAPP